MSKRVHEVDEDPEDLNEEYDDEKRFNDLEGIQSTYKGLYISPEERQVIDLAKKGENIFLHGITRTGKTFTVKEIATQLRALGKNVILTSAHSIGALALNAPTIQVIAHLSINESLESVRERAQTKTSQSYWVTVDTLIIDDISYLKLEDFERINIITSTARDNHRVFGGIQMILSGNFFQVPYTVSKAEQVFCFESSIWSKTVKHVLELNTVYNSEDLSLVNLLKHLQIGKVTKDDIAMLQSRVGASIDRDGILPTELYCYRTKADQYNQDQLTSVPGKEYTYYRIDGVYIPQDKQEKVNQSRINIALDTLRKNVPLADKLVLKVGMQVILLVNLSADYQLTTGSRGKIIGFNKENIPLVEFNSITTHVFPYNWRFYLTPEQNVNVYVAQIPLAAGYGISLDRLYDQSMDLMKIELDTNNFQNGHAYMMLSRLRNFKSLSLTKFDKEILKCNPKVSLFYNNLETSRLNRLKEYTTNHEEEEENEEEEMENEAENEEEDDEEEDEGESSMESESD